MPPERAIERRNYRRKLETFKAYQLELGLELKQPTKVVRIVPGTEGEGRPVGGLLPLYPQEECGIDEFGMPRVLFNLFVLTGFRPLRRR